MHASVPPEHEQGDEPASAEGDAASDADGGGEPYTMAGDQPVEVLLAGSDPEFLQSVAGRVTRDGVECHTVATTDAEAAIDRIDDGDIDCLIATYDPSAGEGLSILDYLRNDAVEVPVILLPSGPTTVVVSENLVVDVASVVTRDDALADEALDSETIVDAVERRQADEAARRRQALESAIGDVAGELSRAGSRGDVEASLVEELADTDAVDGAWMTDPDEDDPSVRAGAGEAVGDGPPVDGAPAEAARRALASEQPQVTSGDDGAAYAAVPVTPERDENGVLTLASESRYAFSDEETRVLGDVGDTARRAIDDIARESMVPGELAGRDAFDRMLAELSVPVVAYSEAGWVHDVNESFADLVGESPTALVADPVWEVLPAPRLATFEDYWASFSPGQTRTQLVELAAADGPRQLVTTRVDVDDEPFNVALAVEPAEEAADPWFADVLAYEFRHWLSIAEEAVGGDADEESAVLEEVVERMQDAMASEVQAARASAAGEGAGEDGPGLDDGDLSLDRSDLAGAASGEDPDGDLSLDPQPVSELARDAWMTVVGEFGDYEVRGDTTVLADETLLHRLFAHLFRTLLSYGNASGVDVGVTEGGFFVADDGSGVAHEDREYADVTTMTDAASGAGVRVARRLARRHGWDIDVTANDDGGTRFEVRGVDVVDR